MHIRDQISQLLLLTQMGNKLDEISLAIDALTFYECDVTSPIIPPIINSGKAIYINPPTTIPINITGKKITVQSNFMQYG